MSLLVPVALLLGILLLFLLYNVKIYLIRRHLAHIPSPKLSITPLWFLGHIPLVAKRIKELGEGKSRFDVFESIQKEVEETLFALFFVSANIIICIDTDMTRQFLLDHRVFKKPTAEAQNRMGMSTHVLAGTRVFGLRGLIFEPGTQVWYSKRKVMNPAFHKSHLQTLFKDINELADTFVHRLKAIQGESSVNIFPMFCRFAYEVVYKCNFSMDVKKMESEVLELNEAVTDVFKILQIRLDTVTWPLPWTFRSEKAFLKSRMSIIHTLLGIHLKNRLESQIQTYDILSHIINANLYDETRPQAEILEDIIDDFFAFMVAGGETTANTLAFCLFYLLKNKDICKIVRDEIDTVLEGKLSLDYEDLEKLNYMDQVIKEVLRLHSPVLASLRVTEESSPTVCGVVIPKRGYLIPECT